MQRLSEQSISSVIIAYDEMRRTDHALLTPLHLLLGVIGNQDSTIGAEGGIDLDALRRAVDRVLSEDEHEHPPGEQGFTDEATRIIDAAAQIAQCNDVASVHPEHVFVALVRHSADAARCLSEVGVDVAEAERRALKVIDELRVQRLLAKSDVADRKVDTVFNQSKAAERAQQAQVRFNDAYSRGAQSIAARAELAAARNEFWAAFEAGYPPGFAENVQRLKQGELGALEMAVTFLEDDPWFFRTGYEKAELIRFINRMELPENYAIRLRRVVLQAVEGRDRREFRAYCRLARKVDDTALREALTELAAKGATGGARRKATWVLEALGIPRQERA